VSRPPKIPTELTPQVLAAYRAGSSLQELGAQYGCSSRTVARLLKINGVKVRQGGQRARVPDESLPELVRLFWEGQTPTELALHFSCSGATITKALRAQGLSTQPPPKIPVDQRAALVSSYQAGATLTQLAQQHGCSQRTVRLALREQGVGLRRQGAIKKYTDVFADRVLQLRGEGLSYEAIAQETGVSTTVVGRILKDRGAGDPFKASGERHGHWKGGRANAEGYVLAAMSPDHPFAPEMRRSNGYCLEHRLVMAEHLGRPLRRSGTVHHINGDKTDNQVENLQLRQGKHGKHGSFQCLDCGSQNVGPVELGCVSGLRRSHPSRPRLGRGKR